MGPSSSLSSSSLEPSLPLPSSSSFELSLCFPFALCDLLGAAGKPSSTSSSSDEASEEEDEEDAEDEDDDAEEAAAFDKALTPFRAAAFPEAFVAFSLLPFVTFAGIVVAAMRMQWDEGPGCSTAKRRVR